MSDENIVSDNTDDLSSLFDGSITADDLRQSKLRKSSRNGIATKNEYRFCRCGCAYKLSVRITCDGSSGIEQIHYKEVMVRCNCYLT